MLERIEIDRRERRARHVRHWHRVDLQEFAGTIRVRHEPRLAAGCIAALAGRVGALGQEVRGLHLGERRAERGDDEIEIGVAVRKRQEARPALPGVHAFLAHRGEVDRRQRQIVRERDDEPRREMIDLHRRAELGDDLAQALDERASCEG